MSSVIVGTPQSRALVDGVAATLRMFERQAAGTARGQGAAARRLGTFQRSLARALQAAHLESVQELGLGEGG